jgi:hypothetical protein
VPQESIASQKLPEKKGPAVNVATRLDPDNPISPDYSTNFFTAVTGQRYLPFFGDNDSYPNVVWALRSQSITQDACVTSISLTCIGGGIQIKNMEIEKVDPEFLTFLSNINTDNESLADVIKSGIECVATDGNAWAEIVKGSFGSAKYVRVYMHSSLICRLGEIPKDKEKPESVLKSRKFGETRTSPVSSRYLKAAVIPLYSPNPLDKKRAWTETDNGDLSTMIHLKSAYKGSPFYGVQQSKASITHQYAEYKLIRYNTDCLDNQMVLSAALIFKSAMTQAEANTAAKEIIKTHTGNGKNGRVAVISSENGIEDFEIKTLETQKEGSYKELDTRLVEKIITANNWDAIFFGSSNEGALGKGSTYIRAVYDVKKTTVIDPICRYWINNFLKPLIGIAADHLGKPEWLKYDIGFLTAMPFSYSSDINVNKIMKKNEGRNMIGLPEVTDSPEWEQPIDGNVKTEPNVPPEPTQ